MPSETLNPNGAGYYQQWSLNNTSHWEATSDDLDTTYIYCLGDGGSIDIQALNDPVDITETDTINSVTYYVRAYVYNGGGGPERIDFWDRADSTDRDQGDNLSLVGARGSWQQFNSQVLTTAPDGGGWTLTKLQSLQAGIQYAAGDPDEEIRISEIWAVVDYTTGFAAISKILSSIHGVQELIFRLCSSTFGLKELRGKILLSLYNTFSSIKKIFSLIFNVKSILSKMVSFISRIQIILLKKLDLVYRAFQDITKLVTFRFYLKTLISSSLSSIYDILSLISVQLNTRFNIKKFISKNIVPKFNARGMIAKLMTSLYNIISALQSITKILSSIFDTVEVIGKKIDLMHRTFQSLGKLLNYGFLLKESVSKNLELIQDIFSLITKQIVIKFNIRRLVSRIMVSKFSIQVVIGRSLNILYDILSPLQTIIKTLSSVSKLRSITSKVLKVIYNVVGVGTITGITRDSANNPLGNCRVDLFKTSNNTFVATTDSNVNGEYTFSNIPKGTTYFLRSYKSGTPNVFGTTDENIEPT